MRRKVNSKSALAHLKTLSAQGKMEVSEAHTLKGAITSQGLRDTDTRPNLRH